MSPHPPPSFLLPLSICSPPLLTPIADSPPSVVRKPSSLLPFPPRTWVLFFFFLNSFFSLSLSLSLSLSGVPVLFFPPVSLVLASAYHFQRLPPSPVSSYCACHLIYTAPAQHSTAQHGTAQLGSALHCTPQHNTARTAPHSRRYLGASSRHLSYHSPFPLSLQSA
ncbi:hypothetical protein LY76DRAFT_281706 [Colletotrichum caudatum]|nr:hypothetical protein LY76DRAFT_281706 [Colletotrichum caudatum]